MPPGVMLRRIILPQVFRRMLPALTNRMIELAKVTSTASILTVNELMYQGRLLSSTGIVRWRFSPSSPCSILC